MKTVDEFVSSQLRARSFVFTRGNLGMESDEAFHRLVEELIVAPPDDRFTIAGYHRNANGLYAIVYCEPRIPVRAPGRRGRSQGSGSRTGLGSPAADAAVAHQVASITAFVNTTTQAGDLI
jgi:hypothetical protein